MRNLRKELLALGAIAIMVSACGVLDIESGHSQLNLSADIDGKPLGAVALSNRNEIAESFNALSAWAAKQELVDGKCKASEGRATLTLTSSNDSRALSMCSTESRAKEAFAALVKNNLRTPADSESSNISSKNQALYGWASGCQQGSDFSCCMHGGGGLALCAFWFAY
jgi:hypothetical protein